MSKISFFLILTFILTLFACENTQERVGKDTLGIREISIEIQEGKVVNHDGTIMAKKGENVRLVFSSDESLTVHLHGYDIEKQIKADDTSVMEFLAKATGRFVITSHSSHDTQANDSDHGTSLSDHAELFESDTLQKGDVFEYLVPPETENMAIPYHDHMNHDNTGSIIVSSHHEEGPSLIIVSDHKHRFDPMEVTVKPGTIVRWEIDTEEKVRITSGNLPTAGHNGGFKHEEDEKALITLEIHP